MNLTTEQLAELIAGIARAQNAIIDAVERAEGGWRNAHLIPMLNVAANVRSAEPRLLDLPARVLLRAQGRGALDIAAIVADLERLISGVAGAASASKAAAAAASAPAAPRAAPAAAPAAPAAAAAATAVPGSELDFSSKP
jgi:hypothetical protein